MVGERTVARAAELDAIDQLLAGLERGPRALYLFGPPGIGKSQLWADGVDRARSKRIRVCTTRPSRADAQSGFTALRDLIGTYAEPILGELPVPQRRALAVALLLDDLGPDGIEPDVVGVAFASALRVLSNEGPMLVAVDDAQWVDATSRAALAFAFRRLVGEPIGLLATVRVEPATDLGDLVVGPTHGDRCNLRPLTVDELNVLVRERTGRRLRRPTLRRLHELSGGNPYFALELVRTMAADEELGVPVELAVLLHRRLRALTSATRDMMLATAALAEPTRDLLAELDPHIGEAIAEAIAAEVIEDGIGVVHFTHPLLGSVCYAAATPADRRAMHGRLAAVLHDPVERAHHLALAADCPDVELARTVTEATALARRRGALATAADLAELAVSVSPDCDADRTTRVGAAAQLRFETGDIGRAEQLLSDALERAVDDQDRALIRLRAGELASEHDEPAAVTHFRFVVEHATDDQLRVDALCWLAVLLYNLPSDETGPALAAAAEAVRIAELSADPLMLSGALCKTADIRYFITGEIQRAAFERAIALAGPLEDGDARRSGGGGLSKNAALAYANTLMDAWELDDARRIIAPLVAHSRASGSAELAADVHLLGLVELNAGNLRHAHELLAEAVDLAGQTGRLDTELYSTFRLAWVEGLLGDVERSRRTCHRAIRLAEHGNGFVRGGRLSLGYLENSLEHYEEAWTYLDPTNPLTGVVSPQRPVVAVPEQVEVLVGLGRSGEARALLEPYEQRATELARTFALARVAHCRGLILAAEGDLAGAESVAAQAVAINAEHRWAVHLGRSLLALGAVQRRRRRKADARATLEQSVAVLDEAGAVIWRDRARRELGRIGGRSAPSGSHLSATETRIAELVSSGYSNAEVAQALHLSRKTIEWNLSKIYRKLGVRSRTGLAARDRSDEFTR